MKIWRWILRVKLLVCVIIKNIPNCQLGLSATVTEDGFCNNGCFETTFMYTSNGQMKKLGLFPYKALMDNSNFLDSKNNKLWVQVR